MITTLNYHIPYSFFQSLVWLAVQAVLLNEAGIETGSGHFPGEINGRQNKAPNFGEGEAVDFFNEHTDEVSTYVDSIKLLVFDVRVGWEPLCRFLDVPVPDTPFPMQQRSSLSSIPSGYCRGSPS